jgi:prepilin-type processing-associated H-X9-DG protein
VSPWTAIYFPVPIHNTGANVAFADGHSKWMKAPVPPATSMPPLVTASPNAALWDLQ